MGSPAPRLDSLGLWGKYPQGTVARIGKSLETCFSRISIEASRDLAADAIEGESPTLCVSS